MSHQTTASETLRVELGERSYDILIGPGLLDRLGEFALPVLPRKRAVLIADSHTGPLYLETARRSLEAAGLACEEIVLPAGEATKSFAAFHGLVEDLLSRRVERKTCLVALGGGMIGDITGFAAAVTLRGMPFIQVPTTLLAQVDSSVGGKTGINSARGKNLVGAFHQPLRVVADTASLDSLPRRELLSGYAEVLKYGLIDDPEFFDWLENNGAALIAGDTAARGFAVARSCRAKARIVAADEYESGPRALLNLGHTFGHALEAETGYGERLLHGEAVAIGMVMAFDLSARLGLCPPADVERLRRHLGAAGLATGIGNLADGSWTVERLLSHMASDKKMEGGTLTFVMARGIGRAFLSRDVPADALRGLLADYLRS